MSRALQEAVDETINIFEREVNDDCLSQSLRKLVAIKQKDENSAKMSLFSQAIKPIYEQKTDSNSYIRIVNVLCRALWQFAQYPECYNESADHLRKILYCVNKWFPPESVDSPLLVVINTILKLFLSRNDFTQARQTVDNAEQRHNNWTTDYFSAGDIANFEFFRGKIAIVARGDYALAGKHLETALRHVPLSHKNDRRLILSYLVPLRLRYGYIPSRELIAEYKLEFFVPLIDAVINGQLGRFDAYVEENQIALLRLGIWEVVLQARRIAEKNLIQMIHKAHIAQNGNEKIMDLSVIYAAVNQECECSEEAVVMMLCDLVRNAGVKVNIAHKLGKVVFASPAFPPIECPFIE